MLPLSVIIVCKNAEATICACVQAALELTNDVVVADTGSIDNTINLLEKLPVRLIQMPWEGYGKTKNKTAAQASHPWILSIDADEVVSLELTEEIAKLFSANDEIVYSVNRLNYLGRQAIHWGEWRHDWTPRLYHKQHHRWNEVEVHESLVPAGLVQKLGGRLHHYTAPDIHSYQKKLQAYAWLSAKKYLEVNKPAAGFRMIFSPLANFLKNYFLRLGLLDGKAGLQVAVAHAWYSFLKYRYLLQLMKNKK